MDMADKTIKGLEWATKLNSLDSSLAFASKIGIPSSMDNISKYAGRMDRLMTIEEKLNTRFGTLMDVFQNSKVLKASEIGTKGLMGAFQKLAIPSVYRDSIDSGHVSLAELAMGVQERMLGNSSLYQKQMRITEQLGKGFYAANLWQTPSWVDKMNVLDKAIERSKVRWFDVYSSAALSGIEDIENSKGFEPKDVESSLDEVSSLLAENGELKDKLDKLYKSIGKNIARNGKKRKKPSTKELLSIQEKITIFIHRNLFKNTQLSRQKVYILIGVLSFLFTVLMDIYLSANGSALFNSLIGDDANIKTSQQINKTNNFYFINSPTKLENDFVICNANLYLRNTLKSKCLGRIERNTTVLILSQKSNWCFIEAIICKLNKKTKVEADTVVRAWIAKKYLDSFQ